MKSKLFALGAVLALSLPVDDVEAQTCGATLNAFVGGAGDGNAYANVDPNGNYVDPPNLTGVPSWNAGWHRDSNGNTTGYLRPTFAGLPSVPSFLAGTVPSMPIYRPYDDTSVQVSAGWMYNPTDSHNAMDWFSPNGSFEVRAVADGVVVWSGFHPSPGNVVIVEHTAANGQKFRTIMHHLRNGRDHDIDHTLQTRDWCITSDWCQNFPDANGTVSFPPNVPTTCAGSTVQNCTEAKLDRARAQSESWERTYDDALSGDFIRNYFTNPDQYLSERWGTNNDLIQVSIGETVRAGQLIGYAGATGADQGGTHLHIMYAREATRKDGTTAWTLFDPYGLYALDKNCYVLANPSGSGTSSTQHLSMEAPVYEWFTGTTHNSFQNAFSHFARFGWYPETIEGETINNIWRGAGTFAPGGRRTKHDVSLATYLSEVSSAHTSHRRPSQVSVTEVNGAPRYSVIFIPETAAWTSYETMSESDFSFLWSALYASHELVEIAPYTQNGALKFAGVWEQRANARYAMRYRLTASQVNSWNQTYTAQGLSMVRLYRYDHPGYGVRYAALWRVHGTPTIPLFDLSASGPGFLGRALGDVYRVVHTSAHAGAYTLIVEPR